VLGPESLGKERLGLVEKWLQRLDDDPGEKDPEEDEPGNGTSLTEGEGHQCEGESDEECDRNDHCAEC
jgi:hypothetical protein